MRPSSDWTVAQGRRALLAVAAVCAVIQITSATLQSRSFHTPNAATWMAQTLVRDGKLSVAGLRAHQLPSEAMYLAVGFKFLPEFLWRYLHVPVAVLLVTAVATVGLALGGPSLAVASGLVASVDPFMIHHGPVWDDVALGAAMEWALFALVVMLAAKTPAVRLSTRLLVVVATIAAIAAMTRSLSQVVVLAVAVIAIAHPRFRSLRPVGVAIMLGVVLALGAWGTRNALVLGSFEIGSTHDGEVLLRSNCGYTRQGIRELGMVGAFTTKCLAAHEQHVLDLPELDFNRELRNKAFAYIASNPADVAETAAFKLLVSLSGFDFASPSTSRRNIVAVSSNLITLALGLYGLTLVSRRIERSMAQHLVVVMWLITGVLTLALLAIGPTGIRYRLGFSGFLYLGVAMAVMHRLSLGWKRPRVPAIGALDAIGGMDETRV